MRRRYIVTARGKQGEWGVVCHLPPSTVDDMRADGVEIIEPIHMVPWWIAGTPFMPLWMAAQDVFAFRNPFRNPFRNKGG